MKLIQIYKTASKNLLVNKRRSLLTMLGLIIGIASVILVMSTGAGAQSLITGQIQQRGTDQIVVLAGASDPNGPPASALGIIITTLTEDDKEAILNKANVRHLQEASGYITGNRILRWQSEERSVTFTGANASYQTIEKVSVEDGRFFSEAEAKEQARVMVMGAEIATEIFGNEDPVGEAVKLDGKGFTVIGVLKAQGTTVFEDVDNSIIIPLRTAQRDILGIRHVTFIRAIVDDEKYINITEEEIRQTLIDRHGEEDFSIRNTASALDILTNVTDALRYFLVAIAAVSLFVGGVGIMNIMLIAVQEKTREVGLRKSVGAKDTDILFQFLVETVLLSTIGGVVGLLIGVLLAFAIATVVQGLGYDYAFIVSLPSVVVSICVALLIGLVFGVYPAKKAAALDPIDALRYE